MPSQLTRVHTPGGTDRTAESQKYMWLKKHLLARGAQRKHLDSCFGNTELRNWAIENGYLSAEGAAPADPISVADYAGSTEQLQQLHQLIQVSSESTRNPPSSRAADFASELKAAGFKVVAFDMDQTITKVHSRGRLGRGKPLVEFIKGTTPDFEPMVQALVAVGLKLAVATHSDEAEYGHEVQPETHILGAELAQTLLEAVVPDQASSFKVVSYNPRAHKDRKIENGNKRSHIRQIAQHYGVDEREVLLLDDDRTNVENTAGQFSALHVNPEHGFEIDASAAQFRGLEPIVAVEPAPAEDSPAAINAGCDTPEVGFVTIDERGPAAAPARHVELVAWQQERVHARVLIGCITGSARVEVQPLVHSSGCSVNGVARAIGKVLAEIDVASPEERTKPVRKQDLGLGWVEDPLEPGDGSLCTVAGAGDNGSWYSVWLSWEPAAGADVGRYDGAVVVHAAEDHRLTVTLRVLPHVLAPREQWAFKLNLWTNPWAVLRYAGYSSKAHWTPEVLQLLKEHVAVLADAGQKCVTATIVQKPWKNQTFDPHYTMVSWSKEIDGSWVFDFTKLEMWIDIHSELGITGPVELFSVLPWPSNAGCEVQESDPYAYYFYDKASSRECKVEVVVGSPEFEAIWEPFLRALVAQATASGWIDRMRFAFDERNPRDLDAAFAFLARVVPGAQMAAAGNWRIKTADACQDFVGMIKSSGGFMNSRSFGKVLCTRASEHRTSSFYTCANPKYRFPDTKLANHPSDAVWLGWHAAAVGFSGYLRWAYDSWPQDPLKDARFEGTGGTWLAGECFLAYPGGRGSIRLERLRDGIQDFEKIRHLRMLGGDTAQAINSLLEPFRHKMKLESCGVPQGMVASARHKLNDL